MAVTRRRVGGLWPGTSTESQYGDGNPIKKLYGKAIIDLPVGEGAGTSNQVVSLRHSLVCRSLSIGNPKHAVGG